MDSELASSKSGSLAPGFRFHPTDEELVFYYLRRKICGKPFRFDAISEIDIYKVEPWDLPGKSRLKSRDLEWYFFSVLDKKYGNGSRTNRATDRGYWKTTGKDRAVYHRTQIVGMKKTLVYHNGRAPRGERTNWVMHEYRLIDEAMQKAGIVQDAFVLCRIFRKSGSGPKNGEQYGAPFIEEEWEADELVLVPKDEFAEELPVSDDACPDSYLDEDDLEQIFSAVDPSHEAPLPLNVAYRDENHYVDESTHSFVDAQEVDPSNEAPLPLNVAYVNENHYVEESTDFIGDAQELLVDVDENNHVQEQSDGRTLFNLPVQYDMDAKSVKREYIGEPSYAGESSNTENPVDVDYFLDESFLDAMDNPQFGDGTFIETNDLKQPAVVNPSSFDMLDEYLQFFDTTDDNVQHLGFDYSNMMQSEDLPSDPASLLTYKDEHEGTKQETVEEGKQQLEDHSNEVPSSSKQEPTKFGSGGDSDFHYPFTKHASRMLGNIPAPPAFASEFPTKDTTLHMNSASSSSIHVTAGIIQIRNVTLSGSGMDLSFGKHGRVNVILSFGLSRGNDYSADSQPASSILSDKANSTISWGWFYFMFMWVLFLTMSFKIGSYICAN